MWSVATDADARMALLGWRSGGGQLHVYTSGWGHGILAYMPALSSRYLSSYDPALLIPVAYGESQSKHARAWTGSPFILTNIAHAPHLLFV
jgi:hypothetical protein